MQGKYPSAKICLKALGFRKRSGGLWLHAGVRGAVDYGDGTVPRPVAGRMLRLLGVAAERGNAPSGALCRQLEQQALMALRQRGVVPSSRIDTGKRHGRIGRVEPDDAKEEDFMTNVEAAGMPPVGWRPPGFTPSAVVLKPAPGVPGLLQCQRSQQQTATAATKHGTSGRVSAKPKGPTVSVEKLARLARPKDKSSPVVRSRPGRNGANGVREKTDTNKQQQRDVSQDECRSERVSKTDGVSNGKGSDIDVAIKAKELMQGRGFNHKLFVLCPTPEPEPEQTPETSRQEPRQEPRPKTGPSPSATVLPARTTTGANAPAGRSGNGATGPSRCTCTPPNGRNWRPQAVVAGTMAVIRRVPYMPAAQGEETAQSSIPTPSWPGSWECA